ncbi:hypothetical protein GCM10007092_13420 [Thermus composti]|uniref:YbbR-like domain-containing protein n=1 Tax=Thermus composti TaxID=532059 RepID=A0ABV6PY17_9DEIN|nr:hypothetical protein [Thermus composti]GGN00695.1 hypothetical protein GCM10007092_13420 [Thermus composti]
MRDWLGFLLALLIAFALWQSLREQAPVVERALSVPLQVVGLEEQAVAEGVPREVLLRLRGPAPLVEGENLPVSAYLDLSEVDGGFNREVRVVVPQGVEVVEVRPARVEGRVEALLARTLPVEVHAPGFLVETEPKAVTARGPRSQVEVAVSALGLDLGAEEVLLTAFSSQGPLPQVVLSPERVRVVARRPLLFAKEVALKLALPEGFRLLDYTPKTLRVVGPRDLLEGLQEVEARPQGRLTPGEVEVALDLGLPPGVEAVGRVWARLRLALE